MSRLISSMVVVLPQPDGPTSTTISPRGMSMLTWSTAGLAWPGYRFVNSTKRIIGSAVAVLCCHGHGHYRFYRVL